MHYGFSKTVDLSFKDTINKVTEELKKEGFGILTTIDVKETLKNKIDVDFKKYTILVHAIQRLLIKHCRQKKKLDYCFPAM